MGDEAVADRTEVILKIEGPELTPRTVDTLSALEFASAYFSLLAGVASHNAKHLDLVGLEVRSGSLCLATHTTVPNDVKASAAMASAFLTTGSSVPRRRGLRPLVEHVRDAQRAFSSEESVTLSIDSWTQQVLLADTTSVDTEALVSIETLRCEVMRIGGERPRVRLVSRSEERAFSLGLNRETAEQLAAYLYRDVDVDIKVRRNTTGNIVSGTVERFEPVDEQGEPLDALREWFAPHKPYWDGVEDIENELDRHQPR